MRGRERERKKKKNKRHFLSLFSLCNVDRTTSCRKSIRTHWDDWHPLLCLIYVTPGKKTRQRKGNKTYTTKEKW